MKSQYQGLRSTKPKESNLAPVPQKNQHGMFVKNLFLKETMYSDKTGKFLYLSRKGMRYIIITFHTDANYIFSKPMRNRTEAQMLQAYENIVMRMKTAGLGTKKHVLDNEISK